MSDEPASEVWILGATGRSGRAVAGRLAGTDVSLVLVGRDPHRLAQTAGAVGGDVRTLVAGSPEEIVAQVGRQRPTVVVNTIGPFTETTLPIARACLSGSHYVALANDVIAVSGLFGLHGQAVAAGRTLVTGAGFGVLGTESVVAMLCRDRPGPDRVRVDAVASVEIEAGVVGEALAATVVDGLPHGGRRYEDGLLVRTRLGADLARLTLPDGAAVTTVGVPTGELVAAQRTSGAPFVIAASSEVPTGRATRAILPLAGLLLSVPSVRRFARRRLARVRLTARPRPRAHSWGHAAVRWPDGTSREGWLRTGEAMTFTVAAVAEVTLRLARGNADAGAYTPAAAFGPEIAVDAGGEFVLD